MQKTVLQPIKRGSDLAAAAAEAIGGTPVRPPIMAPPLPDEVGAPARAAFAAAHSDSVPATPPAALGHPLFDAPADLTDRAAKVGTVRDRMSTLARFILSEADELLPIIAHLKQDAAAVKTAEHFDPKLAETFLRELKADVTKLLPDKPKQPEPNGTTEPPTTAP